MNMRIFIIIIVVLLIGAFAAIALGYYPVLRINGEWVLQRTVADRLASTKEVFEGQGLDDAVAEFEEQGGDLFLGVLESIIDERLTRQEAEKIVDNVDEHINRRVDEALEEVDIESTIESAYGIPFESFREQVLVPGALIDILRDQFGEEALAEHLEQMRATADVETYFVPYLWEEGFLAPVQ